MAHKKLCRNCRHFLELSMPNADPSLYFCNNPRTKEGLYQIGFLRQDAPACPVWMSKKDRPSRPQTVFVVPTPRSNQEDALEKLERRIIKIAIVIATILGLLAWLKSDLTRVFAEPVKKNRVLSVSPNQTHSRIEWPKRELTTRTASRASASYLIEIKNHPGSTADHQAKIV